MIEQSLESLARIQIRRPLLVIAVFIIATFFFASGFALIKTETNFEKFVPENKIIESMIEIRDKLGTGTSAIVMIVQTDESGIADIRDKRIIVALDKINQQIEQNEFVYASSSIVDLVKDGTIPEQQEINEILSNDPRTSSLLSDDYTVTLARYIIPDGLSQEQIFDVVREVREIISFSEKPGGLNIALSGSAVQDTEVAQQISKDISFVTAIGFVGVFIVLFLLFRRPSFVGIAIVPIVFGTIWANGAMGLIGIPMSTALVGVFSMIIGIGIDFSIHLIHRFNEEIKKTSLEKAITSAVKNTGRGLIMTTATTVIGFLALLAAVLPVLHDMAIALSMGVLFSFIATIGAIPPLLIIVERRKKKKK